mmetsp:Transcript_20273/g.47387  ORF Transcript_20273/g.47387 Transcript_20273/m.47387 type:complete len:222 (-) Transcript_20273:91-756(-)|eukprot:CAMPEP_0114560540 /NCGR_PEP_ID=MMETSP0114-20121206/11514_1 /TAXON_ID=31324 /ORGANISM="Goniomonas sp, Strain m" /LENGTH=221 /DNA_ID=CAMNT_0001746093 /DNA_START=38 /DNA_END=703 /DNA_ORIENTATION=-
MRRLFGGAKKTPGPTLADATDKVNARGTALDEKIKQLEKQLNEHKQQMAKMRDGPAKNRIKQRALQVLKQKRMYEQQREALYGQAFNMEQASFAQESVQDSITQVNAMKDTSKALRGQMKNIKIEDVERVHDDMDDLMQDSQEIQDVLSRSYAGMDEIDDDELNDELAALDDELLAEDDGLADEMPSYLQDTPAVPAAASATPAAADSQLDEFGLPALPAR